MYNVAFIRIKRIRRKIESESSLCQTSFQFQFLVSVITTRLMLYTIWIVEAVYSCFIIPIYFEQFDIAHIWPATLINLTSLMNIHINLSPHYYFSSEKNYKSPFLLIYRWTILLDSTRSWQRKTRYFLKRTFRIIKVLHYILHGNFQMHASWETWKIGKRNPEIHFPY